MSQIMEHRPIASGKEVCVVCHNDTVMIHRISQDGPPPPRSRFFMLPWQDVTFEQEAIIKKIMRSCVDGLNKHSKVEELLECPTHADWFRTGRLPFPGALSAGS